MDIFNMIYRVRIHEFITRLNTGNIYLSSHSLEFADLFIRGMEVHNKCKISAQYL